MGNKVALQIRGSMFRRDITFNVWESDRKWESTFPIKSEKGCQLLTMDEGRPTLDGDYYIYEAEKSLRETKLGMHTSG